jgi:hypothetical protein
MTSVSTGCPRCGGALLVAQDNEATCLRCGEHLFPGGPTWPLLEQPRTMYGPRKRGRPRKYPLPAAG